MVECKDGQICIMMEKCLYTKQLQEEIDTTTNLREKFKLQGQFFESIEPLLCGDGLNKICCDPGEMQPKVLCRPHYGNSHWKW